MILLGLTEPRFIKNREKPFLILFNAIILNVKLNQYVTNDKTTQIRFQIARFSLTRVTRRLIKYCFLWFSFLSRRFFCKYYYDGQLFGKLLSSVYSWPPNSICALCDTMAAKCLLSWILNVCQWDRPSLISAVNYFFYNSPHESAKYSRSQRRVSSHSTLLYREELG